MKSVFTLAASLAALTCDQFVTAVSLNEVSEADLLLENFNAIEHKHHKKMSRPEPKSTHFKEALKKEKLEKKKPAYK